MTDVWQQDPNQAPGAPARDVEEVTSASRHRTSGQDPDRKEQAAQESQGRLGRLIVTLRRITLAVKVIPFLYTGLFLILYGAYSLLPDPALDVINHLCFVSIAVVIAHLVYSRMLRMCKWHRMACALPLFPQAVDLFDNYIYEFYKYEYIIIVATIIVTMLLFLFCIYKVFFTDEGRIC